MAAASTDKLRKWSRKWVGQIGAAGVSDASTTTIPLSSTTNLPTDTGVTLVIDRVDSAGRLTAASEETIVGVVSGSNMVTCVRGVEGTAQAHSAGAVVELLVTATEHNDLITALLTVLTASGVIDTTKVVDLTTAQTLTTKTLTSPFLTTPQINDTSADHQYVVAPSELSADRTVTLPLLTGNDEFVFKDFTQTLTNKTLTSPVLGGTATGTYTLGGTPTVTSPVISGAGGTGGGRLGWDQDNLNLKVGDATANQIVHVSAWTAFTPSWGGITEGSGTNVGAYCILGKTCHFRAEFTFAANSSATGSFSLALPVTKATGYNGTYDSVVGNVILFDAGTGNFQGVITSLGSIVSLSVSGANVIRATVNATAPFTWTTGDVLTVTGTYEIA